MLISSWFWYLQVIKHYLQSIARQITKDSTELLSLLHVKSAGCFLYIKKVLDGVSENYITMEEIREIPGTLNGLYLWLCLKQFNKKNFSKVRPLVNTLLASNSLSECELYEVVSIAGVVSSRETFQKYLTQLRPLLARYCCQIFSNILSNIFGSDTEARRPCTIMLASTIPAWQSGLLRQSFVAQPSPATARMVSSWSENGDTVTPGQGNSIQELKCQTLCVLTIE